MSLATIKYLGNLKSECVHNASGAKFSADAPVDNRGEGSSFSGTDLCAASLGVCAVTLMGIHAREQGMDLEGLTAEVVKTMKANPRRIGAIEVIFHMPDKNYSGEQKKILLAAVDSCPVRLTLEGVDQKMTFKWAK